jgi:hypothetical protein
VQVFGWFGASGAQAHRTVNLARARLSLLGLCWFAPFAVFESLNGAGPAYLVQLRGASIRLMAMIDTQQQQLKGYLVPTIFSIVWPAM